MHQVDITHAKEAVDGIAAGVGRVDHLTGFNGLALTAFQVFQANLPSFAIGCCIDHFREKPGGHLRACLVEPLPVVLCDENGVEGILHGLVQGLQSVIVEVRMTLHGLAGNADKGAEPFELRGIRKGAKAVDGVVLLELKVDKILMVSCKARFVVVRHPGRCHTARIVVPAVQPRLIDDGSFFQQHLFLLHEQYPLTLFPEKQSRINAENTAADDQEIVLLHI